ncbi:efflux transporter outer membrane subunit [Acetobacter sp. LMG 1636]|uniref:Efflux transporter outer membrane subunit n=1 Tax=Acetobacter fallax TaxID=1737473 RepID=A0ABX0KF36_9PROT|nr:efflux transporter outer membrane subunit [Acetobacter fallax]NHO33726.1 efflux transporter outer membrane subunit [Acetobacter fallax]NHO37287.1 efflux transporter outer membrane subunit [Acetobacter fallax]
MTGVAALLAGCAVGPNYQKPQTWTPPKWRPTQVSDGKGASITVPDAPDVAWWNVFGDAELTSLEERLASQNLDVQRATEELAQSRAQLILAGAERFPALSASGSYARNQQSTKTLQRIISRIGQSSGGPVSDLLEESSSNATIPVLDRWRDGVDATWEVDLWGRVRRQYEAAKAYLEESGEQRRSMLIAREADLARDYVTLRGSQEKLRVLRLNLADASRIFGLSEARYRSGLVSELDEQSARSQVETISAEIPELEQQITLQINAISLLMGSPPGTLTAELSAASAIPPVPPRVPVGVPSDLAQRRPDIRAAAAQLHAATAEVGQAEADFYPKVTIDASFGFQSLSFRDFGFWNARTWNVGPSITLPIFQGGRLTGQLELKKSAQRDAALDYRRTVLSAWKEVDDALTRYSADQARRDALCAQVETNRRSYVLASEQYRHGMTNFLDVLDAERRVLGSETDFADVTSVVSGDLVRLYLSLGGGWESVFPVRGHG